MSPHDYHPSIDIQSVVNILKSSNKVEAIIQEGSTTCYILKGTKSIAERIIPLRENITGEIDFDLAIAIGHKCKCLDAITKWFEENKNWKEGEYFVPNNK